VAFGGRNGTANKNTYLHGLDGLVMGSGAGYYIPYSIRIVGMSFTMGSAETGQFEARRNGVLVSSISMTAASQGSDQTLNGSFAANGVLALYWNSNSGATDPLVRVSYKRVAT